MRVVFSIMLVSVLAINSFAQTSKELERQKSIYNSALKYSDYQVAKNALYNIMALQPELKEYKDTLCFLYFDSRQYMQCILTADEILKASPTKVEVLKVKAISEQTIGLKKSALEDYEKLFQATGKITYLYQISSLQYELKRYGECEQTLNALIVSPESAKEKINIVIGQSSQEIIVKAAAFNIKGVVYKDLRQNPQAIENFEAALKLEPEFALAKANLAAMKAAAEKEKQPENPEKPETGQPENDKGKKGKKK